MTLRQESVYDINYIFLTIRFVLEMIVRKIKHLNTIYVFSPFFKMIIVLYFKFKLWFLLELILRYLMSSCKIVIEFKSP